MSSNFISNELQNIISDNTSGSRELLNRLLVYLRKNREEINPGLISSLHDHFSEFQTIQNFLSKLTGALNNNSLDNFFAEFTDKKVFENIYRNLKPEIAGYKSFITISNSKTILEVIKLAAIDNPNLNVTVSEGRPVCEGEILAEKLSYAGIHVCLITEAQIYRAIQNCDFGIIGADEILANGNVINKVGSNLIAFLCNKFNKPFLVIADKTKLSKKSSFDKKEKPRKEIYSGVNDEIKIDNYYFEEIPKKYITKIITD